MKKYFFSEKIPKEGITSPSIIGIAGYSGSGKTTLIGGLIKTLSSYGYKVGTIKHTHHNLDILHANHPSNSFIYAGAKATLVTNKKCMAINKVIDGEVPQTPYDLLKEDKYCDIFLIEGFKHRPFPKIEIWRADKEAPILASADPYIIALAVKYSDHKKLPSWINTPILDLDDHYEISRFIINYFRLA